jgi:hypothetical protein
MSFIEALRNQGLFFMSAALGWRFVILPPQIENETNMRHIDLHLPKSWPACTTQELEVIAAAMLLRQMQQTRFRPFTWEAVKVDVLFALNHLEIVQMPLDDDDNPVDPSYMVRRTDHEGEEPWPLSAGQVQSIVDEHLGWLTDERAQPVFLFPYPELVLTEDVRWLTPDEMAEGKHHTNPSPAKGGERMGGSKLFTLHSSFFIFQGPPPMLDGYTWREYRLLTEWMTEYMRLENAHRDSGQARTEFLKLLLRRKDAQPLPSHQGAGSQPSAFVNFPPIMFQVILFWWSGLMQMLQREFPKVFKQQSVSGDDGKGKRRRRQQQQRRESPWTFYNRVTATIQKYIGGLSEQDVNNATYGTILQQLNMMAEEAEENKKLEQKYKHKK